MLSAIFCAVPAFSRVLPLMSSEPVSSNDADLGLADATGAPGLLAMTEGQAAQGRAGALACAPST